MRRQMVHGWPLWNLDDIWNNNIINWAGKQRSGHLLSCCLLCLSSANTIMRLYCIPPRLNSAGPLLPGGGGARDSKIFLLLKERSKFWNKPLNYLLISTLFGFSLNSGLFTPMEMLRGEIVKGQLGGCCHPSLPFLNPLWPQAKNTNSNKIEIKWKHHQQATIINRTTESSFSWKVPGHHI